MTASSMLWRYSYRIDPARISPRQINRLWRDRHGGGEYASLFSVVEPSEARGLCADQHSEEAADWWLTPGGGSTLVAIGDEARDRAILSFIIDHLEVFAKVTYGPVMHGPDEPKRERVLFVRRNEPQAGELT